MCGVRATEQFVSARGLCAACSASRTALALAGQLEAAQALDRKRKGEPAQPGDDAWLEFVDWDSKLASDHS